MDTYLNLTTDHLLLDEENPRLRAASSQADALEKLVGLRSEHFENMMISVKENGLDPGDSLYVIKSDQKGKYTVLDGNRRLSALKVLANPSILDSTGVSTKIKGKLSDIASDFDIKKFTKKYGKIRCVLFASRPEANGWIYRRHTGGILGEGRITWGSTEIMYFTGDMSLIDIINFVGRNANYVEKEWESTKSVIEGKKITNVQRLVLSAAGRDHIGISVSTKKDSNEKIPFLSRNPEWAVSVLQRIIKDVRDNVVNSRKINKAEQIKQYFKKLPKALQPKGKKTTPKEFRKIIIKKSKPTVVKKKAKKPTASFPLLRSGLAPAKNSFKPPLSSKGERLLHEATKLNADSFTISAAFVLRAFVELAVNDYMESNKLPQKEKDKKGNMFALSLSQKANIVMEHIINNGTATKDDMSGFVVNIITATSTTSIKSLHGFVHNKYRIPTPEALRAGWDCCVPLFEATYGKVSTKK